MINEILIARYKKAIIESKRFLDRAEKVLKVIEKKEWYHGGPLTASAKRASLDLTRVLAELRKPV